MTNKKGLGAFDFFTIGFGAIVGVGWAVTVNSWMTAAGGPLPAAIGFILTSLMILPVALCYAELSPMLPVAGGSVAFAYKAFGKKTAFVSGWAATIAFMAVLPWEAIYINDILAMLIPSVEGGKILYYVLGSPIYLRSLLIGLCCAVVIFLINWFGAKSSAILQKVLCFVLLASIVLTLFFSLLKADIHNLTPVYENVGTGNHNNFFGGALAMLALAPFFLFGFETIPQGIEDAQGDIKQVGKTIAIAMLAACLTYATILVTVGVALPWQETAAMPTPAASNVMATIYPGFLGKFLWAFILVGVLCGLVTTWNAFFIATPRLLLGMSRAGLLPASFAKIHPKYGTPSFALIVCGIASAVGPFLGTSVISTLTSVTSAALLISWFNDVRALIHLRKAEPELLRPYRLPFGKLIATIGAVMCVVLFIMVVVPVFPSYMGHIGMVVLVVWTVLGFIFYKVMDSRSSGVSEEERKAALFARMK